jgi:hypothetical protein
MKITEIIEDLQYYLDNYGADVAVHFVMVTPENVCDDDTLDIPIKYKGEIGTSLLDSDGVVEIGFDYKEMNNEV